MLCARDGVGAGTMQAAIDNITFPLGLVLPTVFSELAARYGGKINKILCMGMCLLALLLGVPHAWDAAATDMLAHMQPAPRGDQDTKNNITIMP